MNDIAISKSTIIGYVVLGTFFLGIWSYGQIVNEPKAKEAEVVLKQEFSALSELSDSKMRSSDHLHKPSLVSWNYGYDTTKNWQEISSFYSEKAQKSGWVLVKVREDTSPKALYFQKDHYALYISGNDYSFSIGLRWEND